MDHAADRERVIRQARTRIGRRWIPSKQTHCDRARYNSVPVGPLLRQEGSVYVDAASKERWVLQPWYLSVFHRPARRHKLLSYNSQYVAGDAGASELVVAQSRAPRTGRRSAPEIIRAEQFTLQGSYNYNARGLKHFFSDVLPFALFCRCKGR